MSVICFCEHELGNLCAEAAKRSGEPVEEFIKAAVDYSMDNSACYNYTYHEDADPAEAATVKCYLPQEPNGERAEGTARLLRYNLVSNGGRDFVSDKSEAACHAFLDAMSLERAMPHRKKLRR